MIKFIIGAATLQTLNSVIPADRTFNQTKLIDSIQSALNGGETRKATSKRKVEMGMKKFGVDEEKSICFDFKASDSETLRVRDSIASRFAAWSWSIEDLQRYGESFVTLPDTFEDWIISRFTADKVKETEKAKAQENQLQGK
jgi:hypothetical protein